MPFDYKQSLKKLVHMLHLINQTIFSAKTHQNLHITFKNNNPFKVGVDVLDQIACNYTCKRATRRRPNIF